MRIAVMGAGALGGYFGGRLAAAGHEVGLIARGAHLAALQEKGLTIRSPRGDVHVTDLVATDDPGQFGRADVVLFMVKNYDVESAAQAIAPLLGPGTMVVTCQNGVTAHERLAAVIGPEHVVPGVARIPASIPEPGVVLHAAMADALVFAEPDGRPSDRVERFRRAIESAGATAVVPPNILHELWVKMVMQAPFAAVTTLLRLDLGPIRRTPETRELLLKLMAETEAVARAAVPDMPPGAVDKAWATLESLPDTVHASMLDDLKNGKRIEVDYLSGDVVRIGAQHGVETPLHGMFWAALAPFRDGPPA